MDPRLPELLEQGLDREAAEVMLALSPLPEGWLHVEHRGLDTYVLTHWRLGDAVTVDSYGPSGEHLRVRRGGLGHIVTPARLAQLVEAAYQADMNGDVHEWLIVDKFLREQREKDESGILGWVWSSGGH